MKEVGLASAYIATKKQVLGAERNSLSVLGKFVT